MYLPKKEPPPLIKNHKELITTAENLLKKPIYDNPEVVRLHVNKVCDIYVVCYYVSV